jgi:hypothetical protein
MSEPALRVAVAAIALVARCGRSAPDWTARPGGTVDALIMSPRSYFP